MALNEYNKNRYYTKYKRHVDNSHETVSAQTVNELQDDINTQQEESNRIKGTAFEERVYTIFENNLYTNAMFIDTIRTGEYINMTDSSNIETDYEKSLVSLKQGTTDGTLVSTEVFSPYGKDILMNDFFLISNHIIPVGAEIKYYIESYDGERWSIAPNALKTPMHLTNGLKYGFKIIIDMRANSLGDCPVVNDYAILYWDAGVEDSYGMTNPDLQRFP